MKKMIGSKAVGIVAGAVGAAALAAVGTGAVALWKWAKDPNATVFWIGGLPGGRGVRVEKTDVANHYIVQTGYRWHNDAEEAAVDDEPEMEIELPLESLTEEPVPEAGDEA